MQRFAQRPIGPRVGLVGDGRRRLSPPGPLRVRRARRNPPIGWIDDQRGPGVEITLDQPELVVVARSRIVRVDVGDARQGRQRQLIPEDGVEAARRHVGRGRPELGQLLVGQVALARPRRRPLERRGVVVRPDALQIRVAVRGAGNGPGVRGGLRRRRGRQPRHRHHQDHAGNDTASGHRQPRSLDGPCPARQGTGASFSTCDAGRRRCDERAHSATVKSAVHS